MQNKNLYVIMKQTGAVPCLAAGYAGVMELADVPDSKSGPSDGVRVRPPPPAPTECLGTRVCIRVCCLFSFIHAPKHRLIYVFANAARKNEYGGIAQLGERLNGIQEVSGSIPLISTSRQCRLPNIGKVRRNLYVRTPMILFL